MKDQNNKNKIVSYRFKLEKLRFYNEDYEKKFKDLIAQNPKLTFRQEYELEAIEKEMGKIPLYEKAAIEAAKKEAKELRFRKDLIGTIRPNTEQNRIERLSFNIKNYFFQKLFSYSLFNHKHLTKEAIEIFMKDAIQREKIIKNLNKMHPIEFIYKVRELSKGMTVEELKKITNFHMKLKKHVNVKKILYANLF